MKIIGKHTLNKEDLYIIGQLDRYIFSLPENDFLYDATIQGYEKKGVNGSVLITKNDIDYTLGCVFYCLEPFQFVFTQSKKEMEDNFNKYAEKQNNN